MTVDNAPTSFLSDRPVTENDGSAEGAQSAPSEVGPEKSPISTFTNAPAVNTVAARASNLAERRREAEVDRGLVENAQKGDTAAFRRLVERHQRRAFAVAVGIVRDENDANEIVQEAFIRVFKSLDKFQGSSAFFTWLFRIVKNLSIDYIRKPARREVVLYDSHSRAEKAETLPFVSRIDGADPVDAIRRKQLGARIQEALDALPPYHRSVILMREVEGMSYQDMADAMGVSKGTIMSRLFHARQKLQRALSDCYREHVGREPKTRGKKS